MIEKLPIYILRFLLNYLDLQNILKLYVLNKDFTKKITNLILKKNYIYKFSANKSN